MSTDILSTSYLRRSENGKWTADHLSFVHGVQRKSSDLCFIYCVSDKCWTESASLLRCYVRPICICLLRCSPNWAHAASLLRYTDHNQKCTTSRTLLKEWRALYRGHYLHKTQQMQETKIPNFHSVFFLGSKCSKKSSWLRRWVHYKCMDDWQDNTM